MAFYRSNECIYVMTRVFLDMPFFLLLVRYHWCLSKELTQDKKSAFFVNTIISAQNEISWKVTLICFFFVIYSSVFPFFLKTRFYSYEKNALLTLVLNLSHLISLAVLIIPPATNDRWQFFVTLWFQNHCNYINGKAYALITLT